MVDDEVAGVREFIIKDVGIKAEGNPQYRSHISGLLASWKAAKKRGDERHKAEAEQRVHSLPRKISEQEHMEMLNAYVALHGPLKEREIPAEAYIEQKLSQVEDGKIKAEKLSSVCGQDDVDDDDLSSARLRNDGTVMVVRGTKLNTSMPKNAEEFRDKMDMIARCWEFVRLKVPHKPMVQNLNEKSWAGHVKFILGEQVYKAAARTADGAEVYRPAWITILDFELQIRKRAATYVNDKRLTLANALIQAREDRDVFQEFFITPTALSAGVEAARAASSSTTAGAGHSAGAASSSGINMNNLLSMVQRTVRQELQGAGFKPGGGNNGGGKPGGKGGGKLGGKPGGKAGGKVKAKGKAKAKAAAAGVTNKTLKGAVHFSALRAQKCIKYNKGTCTAQGCEWPHECSVCGRTDCAGIYHTAEELQNNGA